MAPLLSPNPRVLRHWGVISGLAVCLLVAGSANADDTHYRGIPIGAHAIGLGGAFTGVADDAASAYHNPAGLVLENTFGLAGGLSIIAWDKLTLSRALEDPEASSDATTKESRTVPIFIAAVLKFGPKDAFGRKKFAMAYSVAQPIFSSANVGITIPADPALLSDTYSLGESDRATWYGISFASGLNLEQSFGLSLYLSVRKLDHNEVGIAADGGMPSQDPNDPPNVFEGTKTAANHQSFRIKSFHFVLRLGWLYKIQPRVSVGVMLQPPGIPLKQTADFRSQFIINNPSDPNSVPPTPATTELFFLDDKYGGNLPIPAELEGGVKYWPAEKVMLAADLSFHGPVRDTLRIKTPDGVSQVDVGGVFFGASTKRRAIVNAAVAGDFYINPKVMIETGFFTDLSSAPGIPENPDQYYLPQINRFGATLSIALNVTGVSLAVGSTFLYGKGDATAVRVDLNDPLIADYTRTQATSRVVYLHITGATQAATDVGAQTQTWLEKRKKEKAAKEAEEDAEEAPIDAKKADEEPADGATDEPAQDTDAAGDAQNTDETNESGAQEPPEGGDAAGSPDET